MTEFKKLTLDDLWQDVPPSPGTFAPESMARLPEATQHYLKHAVAPGTPLASAVRLEMQGQIRLNQKWLPFEAEQVIRWDRGFIWRARVKMGLLSIRGSDRFIDGQGAMQWRLAGIIPVMTADGPDISRSAAARLQIESIWLPSVLLGDDVRWRSEDETRFHATIAVQGYETEVSFSIDASGRLLQTSMRRWGNPEGGAFSEAPFGGISEEESTFQGYTIPTRLRVGWHFGNPRFEPQGEFWRASITSAAYR
jgi:hypothetical protein